MTLNDYLQDLGEQDFLEEKQLEVKKNPKVEELCKIFETTGISSYEDPWDYFEQPGPEYNWPFRNYTRLLEGIDYAAKDVFDFSLVLKEYEEEKRQVDSSVPFGQRAGIFLSVLANQCKDKDFTIMLNHLESNIVYLGCWNTKNITVFGDVYYAADQMEDGVLTINGTPRIMLGHNMSGGKVIVNGNTNANIGIEMKGGEITVRGNARNSDQIIVLGGIHFEERDVGQHMIGGEITIEGNVEGSVARSMRGGSIFVKGDVKTINTSYLSSMMGGKVVINGNAEYAFLNVMHSGEIIIEGDVRFISSSQFKGGKIYVNGDIGHITRGRTEIYHNGKRVGHNMLSRLYYNKLRKNDFVRKHFG